MSRHDCPASATIRQAPALLTKRPDTGRLGVNVVAVILLILLIYAMPEDTARQRDESCCGAFCLTRA